MHKGGVAGFQSGEGPSAGTATRHQVTIHNHHADQTVEVDVPEDRCCSCLLWRCHLYSPALLDCTLCRASSAIDDCEPLEHDGSR